MLRFMWGKQRNSSGAIQPDDFLEDDTLGSYNAGMYRDWETDRKSVV